MRFGIGMHTENTLAVVGQQFSLTQGAEEAEAPRADQGSSEASSIIDEAGQGRVFYDLLCLLCISSAQTKQNSISLTHTRRV